MAVSQAHLEQRDRHNWPRSVNLISTPAPEKRRPNDDFKLCIDRRPCRGHRHFGEWPSEKQQELVCHIDAAQFIGPFSIIGAVIPVNGSASANPPFN